MMMVVTPETMVNLIDEKRKLLVRLKDCRGFEAFIANEIAVMTSWVESYGSLCVIENAEAVAWSIAVKSVFAPVCFSGVDWPALEDATDDLHRNGSS